MKKTNRSVLLRSIAPAVQTKLLRHDKTEAEERFTLDFLLYLQNVGYSGEVHLRCFLVDQFGTPRRPDIYLPRNGIAIEIDGLTRHSWECRQNDIERRDEFYKNLGCHPLIVLDATSVVSKLKMDSFKRGFKDLLFNNRLAPNRVSLINKRLSEGRRLYEQKNPGIFNSHGSLALQMSPDMALNGFKEFHHFGGTRVSLRSKYISKATRETKVIDSMLRRYCGTGEKGLAAKVYTFILGLYELEISEYARIDEIDVFGRENGLDDYQFYLLVKDFLIETWKVALHPSQALPKKP